jgi:hypothetical protein
MFEIPDWRFGQFISNFFGELWKNLNSEMNNLSNDEVLDKASEFLKSC